MGEVADLALRILGRAGVPVTGRLQSERQDNPKEKDGQRALSSLAIHKRASVRAQIILRRRRERNRCQRGLSGLSIGGWAHLLYPSIVEGERWHARKRTRKSCCARAHGHNPGRAIYFVTACERRRTQLVVGSSGHSGIKWYLTRPEVAAMKSASTAGACSDLLQKCPKIVDLLADLLHLPAA
jgi:hypothetical protein